MRPAVFGSAARQGDDVSVELYFVPAQRGDFVRALARQHQQLDDNPVLTIAECLPDETQLIVRQNAFARLLLPLVGERYRVGADDTLAIPQLNIADIVVRTRLTATAPEFFSIAASLPATIRWSTELMGRVCSDLPCTSRWRLISRKLLGRSSLRCRSRYFPTSAPNVCEARSTCVRFSEAGSRPSFTAA